MNRFWMIVPLCILIGIPSTLFADGAGGAFWGSQELRYPWSSEDDDSRFSSSGDDLLYAGGLGYGIGKKGQVSGGFGVGFHERENDESGITGGFGGLVTGQRFFRRPLNVLGLVYVGIGGIVDERSDDSALQDGVLALMGEATLEVSLPLAFFHPTLYAGYQVIASVGDGGLGDAFLSYAPTVGFRMLWGSL